LNVLPGCGEVHIGEKGESAPHGKPLAIRHAAARQTCRRKKRARPGAPDDLRFLRKDLGEESLHVRPRTMICLGIVSDAFQASRGNFVRVGIGKGVNGVGVFDKLIVEFSVVETFDKRVELLLGRIRVERAMTDEKFGFRFLGGFG
jgi:hypothetical protein